MCVFCVSPVMLECTLCCSCVVGFCVVFVAWGLLCCVSSRVANEANVAAAGGGCVVVVVVVVVVSVVGVVVVVVSSFDLSVVALVRVDVTGSPSKDGRIVFSSLMPRSFLTFLFVRSSCGRSMSMSMMGCWFSILFV